MYCTVSTCMYLHVHVLIFFVSPDTDPPSPAPALLDWETVHKKMAWSVVIVLGGSFALADACQVSELEFPIAIHDTLRICIASPSHCFCLSEIGPLRRTRVDVQPLSPLRAVGTGARAQCDYVRSDANHEQHCDVHHLPSDRRSTRESTRNDYLN